MLWIFLALVVALIFAIVNVLDKHIVSDELRDPWIATIFNGFFTFILYIIIVLIVRQISSDPTVIFFSLFAGIFLGSAIFFYYSVMRKEEATRVMTLLGLTPLLVLLLATIFLKEVFTIEKYIGMAMAIFGGFIISIKKLGRNKKKFISLFSLALVVIASFLYASRSIFIRAATLGTNFLSVLLWFATGFLIASCILLMFHHKNLNKKLRKKAVKKGIKQLIFISVMDVVGMVILIWAISIAPAVSLVSAISCVQGLFVFIIATSLSKAGIIVHESLEKKMLIIKLIAVLLVIGGVILIAL